MSSYDSIHKRSIEHPEEFCAEAASIENGEIGWSDAATELSAMHESGNTGDEPIDLICVTLKPGCMAPPAEAW